MFKGLTGLKKAVKGGFSVVAEHSSQLAEQVVGDPSTSRENLKESLKKKVSSVVDATETVRTSENTAQVKDKASEVIHKVKHYGAFGEEYLGFSDPTKDLRKAVKQKEKAAKKARKANKKKTGKKEDLFDPENLAKYKRELEQRKKEEEESLAKAQPIASGDEEEVKGSPASEHSVQDIKFELDLAPQSPSATTPLRSPARTPKEESENWQLFQNLASGVDSLINQKKSELEALKVESFYQRKDPKVEDSDRRGVKKKKRWVNLDAAGFEDHEGAVSGEEDEEDVQLVHEEVEKKEADVVEAEESGPKNPEGYVDIPEDEPIDLEAEDSLFDTKFVDAITSGEVKLAVIPDDPVYDDDPFNTNFAEDIVKKDKEAKRREAARIKFTGLSSVADVLSGKADKVDKELVELTVKQKRRRANRINLIAETETEVTSRDKIGTFGPENSEKPSEQLNIFADLESSEVSAPVVEVKASENSIVAPVAPVKESTEEKKKFDLSEFEEGVTSDQNEKSLTSNVAILAGEFAQPLQEEEDDFDAAFDALAKESVDKFKLDELEKEFADEDVFDTTAVDNILNLVSLANKVEEDSQEFLDTFEDKDPFDTSAYEDITEVLEEELGFESLAKRDPKEEDEARVAEGGTGDVFGSAAVDEPVVGEGWAVFKEDKPARPPPPKPKPEPPRRPPQVHLNPSSRPNTPSVVVKAPSTESIKSWNISVAENLLRKSELEALENEVLVEEEFDPFDTTKFQDKDEEPRRDSQVEGDVDDPFDTSDIPDFDKEERLKREADEEETRRKEAEEEAKKKAAEVDLLTSADDEPIIGDIGIVPEHGPEPDPFDTGFASKVLPDHGDPFDTSYVSGLPGKAEIQALEEEFIDKEDFDPRTEEGTSIPRKVTVPGVAARARPKKGVTTDLKVKVPIPVVEPANDKNLEEAEVELEEEDDPFDTSIVSKVIPVKKVTQAPEVSVEDDDFDPTSTFQQTQKEVDPFDTTIAGEVIPELAESKAEPEPPVPELQLEEVKEAAVKVEEPKVEPKVLELDGKSFKILPPARPRRSPVKRQLTDEDFDPRA